MNADKGYKLRARLQPFIEQDMQVIAELENQMMRRLHAANLRAMEPLVPGQTIKVYKVRGYFLHENPDLTEADIEELLKR